MRCLPLENAKPDEWCQASAVFVSFPENQTPTKQKSNEAMGMSVP
jgi:hypothetical protein